MTSAAVANAIFVVLVLALVAWLVTWLVKRRSA